MKHCPLIFVALILLNDSCSMGSENVHLSPSGKYSLRFYEAISIGEADMDSYYQIVNNRRPDIIYSSIGGSTKLNDNSIVWSPTENTCVIQEDRGSTRIMHLVILNGEDREYYEIYMRPFENRHFRREETKVISVSDEGVTVQVVNSRATKTFSIEDLIMESHSRYLQTPAESEIMGANDRP